MKYNPALDGIRAIAVAMVLGFHAMVPRFSGGYLGVDVFFVLSGFLISSILLAEMERTGSIRVRRFYFRRLVRLTPALVFMLTLYLLLAHVAWPLVAQRAHVRDALIALFYFSDYANSIWQVPEYLRHTWSLSVEEHFYLLWPVVLLGFSLRWQRSQLFAVLILAFFVATGWRIYCDLDNGQGYDWTYYRFDTRLSGLILGSCLAALPSLPKLRTNHINLMTCIALVTIGLCTWRFSIKSTLAVTAGITSIELATIVLIYASLNAPDSFAYKMLSGPMVVFVGRMSYGVYLWHYPIFNYLWDHDPWYLTMLLGGTVSLIMAVISHWTVERYARRLFGLGEQGAVIALRTD